MQNVGLDKSQTGIKNLSRNINNLRYADDTTLMAESEEELKNLLMEMKEKSEKAGLKLNIQKTKIMESSPISSVQFSSVSQSCPTLCNPMNHSTPGLTVHHKIPEFTQTHVHWVGESIQPAHPLSSPSPPALSSNRVFSNESILLMRWPKCWSFSFSISPSNEYSGLISFRMDWLDLLAVQGTLKSLLQHHS